MLAEQQLRSLRVLIQHSKILHLRMCSTCTIVVQVLDVYSFYFYFMDRISALHLNMAFIYFLLIVSFLTYGQGNFKEIF